MERMKLDLLSPRRTGSTPFWGGPKEPPLLSGPGFCCGPGGTLLNDLPRLFRLTPGRCLRIFALCGLSHARSTKA